MKEHQHIERKQSCRDEYLIWICGFANAEGGLLIIGKNDHEQVTGRVNIKKLLVDIPNKVRDILGIMVDVNLRRKKGKEYISNVPIQISVYDNKLMLWNPGRLPSGWTIKQLLKKHASMPFNPDIANVFFRAGMVESWGRGIERIMQACTDAGIPMPELRYEQTGLWVMFPFSADEAKIGSGKSSEKSSEKILTLIKGDPSISARNIAGQLGLTPRAVEKQIAQLKADQRLKRVGPPKGGHWEVLG